MPADAVESHASPTGLSTLAVFTDPSIDVGSGFDEVTGIESARTGEPGSCARDRPLSHGNLRASDFTSVSFGFQFASKLTIGRLGLSLTIEGVGSLGLRSFIFMLVACRMSSPRSSTELSVSWAAWPSSRSALAPPMMLTVYAGFRVCVGGFRCISVRDRGSFLVGSGGVLLDRMVEFAAKRTRVSGL